MKIDYCIEYNIISIMVCKIRLIDKNEIDKVCEILSCVISHMKSIGFDQWDDDYPTRDNFARDIMRGDLYGAYLDGALAGFVALNSRQSEEYCDITWKYSEPCLVVHRLQVDPKLRGKRIAYDLMVFAENLARDKGLSSIRLDTRSDNTPALKLYAKLGYIIRGHVHFPRMMEYEFPCLEKKI